MVVNDCLRADDIVSVKGWVYNGSYKNSYHGVIWSYKKDPNSRMAAYQLYFRQNPHNKEDVKITYEFHNVGTYNKLKQSLAALGYKKTGSALEEGIVCMIFVSKTYRLSIELNQKYTDNTK